MGKSSDKIKTRAKCKTIDAYIQRIHGTTVTHIPPISEPVCVCVCATKICSVWFSSESKISTHIDYWCVCALSFIYLHHQKSNGGRKRKAFSSIAVFILRKRITKFDTSTNHFNCRFMHPMIMDIKNPNFFLSFPEKCWQYFMVFQRLYGRNLQLKIERFWNQIMKYFALHVLFLSSFSATI